MSEQMKQLGNIIDQAKIGNQGAITLLREICSQASAKAPVDDLLKMANLLYCIGIGERQ